MIPARYRLVTEQDGHTHVSGTVLAASEIHEMLDWESQLHRAAGWTVQNYGAMLRLSKDDTIRWVWVRSRPPLEDTL